MMRLPCAEGTDAYCRYDPGFDRNFVCLAEFGWNQGGQEDLYQFKSRYARALLNPALEPWEAAEAMNRYDQAFGSEAWNETVATSLLYYWHTYPAACETGLYPRDTILELTQSKLKPMRALRRAMSAKAAAEWFVKARTCDPNPLPLMPVRRRPAHGARTSASRATSGGCRRPTIWSA
jgi:hypothetical protein